MHHCIICPIRLHKNFTYRSRLYNGSSYYNPTKVGDIPPLELYMRPLLSEEELLYCKKITMIMVIGSSTTKGVKYCLAPTCGTGANPAAIYVIRYASN